MNDPIAFIILALQSILAPTPAPAVPPPDTIAIAAAQTTPSWQPPMSWSLPADDTMPVVTHKLSCELKRKGDTFAAVIVAGAAYSIVYELNLHSTGNNTLKVTRRDELDLAPGTNRLDLHTRLKVSGQQVAAELTLHGAGDRDTSCAIG